MLHFKNFPVIEYGTDKVVNILLRGKVRQLVLDTGTLFYPYTMKDQDRLDIISHKYYGSVDYAWLICYANDIFDMYYDIALSQNAFDKYIISKYGSLEDTQSLADESLVLDLGLGTGTFAVNQVVYQGQSENVFTSKGTITSWDSSVKRLRLKNVQGNFHPLTGPVQTTGGASYTIQTRKNVIHHYEVITTGLVIDQETFLDPYSFIDEGKRPVTIYDHESRLNEAKRTIKIIDKKYIGQIVNEMKTLFKDARV